MHSSTLFDWAIRASLLLALALLVVRLLERRSATVAHRFLASMFLSVLILLPCILTAAPGWRWGVPIWMTDSADPGSNTPAATRPIRTVSPPSDIRITNSDPVVSEITESSPASPLPPEESHADQSPLVQPANESLARTDTQRSHQASPEPVETAPQGSSTWAGILSLLDWRTLAVFIWISMATLLAMRLSWSLLCLKRFLAGCRTASVDLSSQVLDLSRKSGIKRQLHVLLSESGSMPMACWLGRWTIVVPEDIESWPTQLQEVTLLHELGHIARRDAWIDYLAQTAACLLWPNPFVWLAAADTRRLRERACDEWSLSRYGGDARQYALNLVEIVEHCQQQNLRPVCALADKSGLEARLKWLFSCPTSRKRWNGFSLPIVLIGCGLAIAVATAEPTEAKRDVEATDSEAESIPVVLTSEPTPDSPVISANGKIVDQEGNPVKGASVVLRANLGGSYYYGQTHSRDVLASTKTDSQGNYRFTAIPVPARLSASIDKLTLGQPGVQILAWTEGAGLQWKPVTSFEEKNIDFQLQPEAIVSGVATDENGALLTSGKVVVTGFTKATENGDGFFRAPGDLNTIFSEVVFAGSIRDGHFSLANMPQDYRLMVRLEGQSGHRVFFMIDTGSGTFKEFTSQNTGMKPVPVHRTPIQISAKQFPCISIKVVDAQGKPVTSGSIQANHRDKNYGGMAPVDGEGNAFLIANNPGIHDVIYLADPLTPSLGVQQECDIKIGNPEVVEMTLPPSRMLSGRVIDSDTGKPVCGVYVQGSNPDLSGPKPHPLAVSGHDGRFELPVTEGTCKLSILQSVHGYSVPSLINLRYGGPEPNLPTVEVSKDLPLEEVEIKLARGRVINGSVVNEQGLPASGVKVIASDGKSPYRETATTTDAEGHFNFSGLSPYIPVRISVSSQSTSAEELIPPTETLPWDQTLTKNLKLTLTPSTSVVGRVVLGEAPVAGVRVSLMRAGPSQRTNNSARFTQQDESRTDEQGRYHLTGLRKGDQYRIQVEPQQGAEVRDWLYHSPYSQTVNVDDGKTIDVPDAILKSNGQTLAGIVVDPDGNPVEGISVSARLASGGILSRPQGRGEPPWTTTDREGRFRLTYLPEEAVTLMAYKKNPKGGIIRYPSHVSPRMNADDIRIVLDPSLDQEPEDLD